MERIDLDIIIPVMNEAANVGELTKRVDLALRQAKIPYRIIFVVDQSSDDTEIRVKELARKYPILVHLKKGRVGKCISILEGAEKSSAPYLVMIDGDLQYPPEKIPDLYREREKYGVVVGNRVTSDYGRLRHLASKINRFFFGKLLLGWDFDTQSGLKLFRKDILNQLDKSTIGAWSLDAPLIHTALELGHNVGSVDIVFGKRAHGQSTLRLFSATMNIVLGNFRLRFGHRKIYHLPGIKANSMLGAGLAHKRNRFITHSTLPHHESAFVTLVPWQKLLLILGTVSVISGLIINPLATITIGIAGLSAIYFIDVFFTLFLVLKSLHFPPEITFENMELGSIEEKNLPIYSILCPLYREARVLPQFLKNIAALDYPQNKLDVLLLLEEDDQETIEAAQKLDKPNYLRVIIVPNSLPKTKPKACNYGLSLALGKYIVIYDAEDQPEPLQLKKAYLAFQKLGGNVRCLQAKLNYYNPHHNLLTRLFTAEYSLWFDLVLPALQTIDTTIPLGGTSNHFRKDDLVALHGWDAFNVTEDCDLGVRLRKGGYKTAIIDSITLEEANSSLPNWVRQRSRWIKGYLQTYLVHTRNPIGLARKLGWHALIFQLVIGARTTFMLINPILWAATIAYFALYKYVGPTIESFYPAPVFYMAVFSLAAGNFLYLYNYMIGCAKRGQWTLIKFVFLIPFYWLLVSSAAVKAFSQLVGKPHFWEKTVHGLHLNTEKQKVTHLWLPALAREWSLVFSGGTLVVASLAANFINFLGSTFLARSGAVSFELLGLVSLIGGFLSLSDIPVGSLGRTVTYRIGYLLGRFDGGDREAWKHYLKSGIAFGLMGTAIWSLAIPLLSNFFQSTTVLPFLLFTPVWILSVILAVNSGYLTGTQKFTILAVITVSEALAKLAFTFLFVEIGLANLVYLALPLSLLLSLLLSFLFIGRITRGNKLISSEDITDFPGRFFATSVILKISSVLFLTMDLVLAKHFLAPDSAGQYALLSSIGKMVYLFGGQFGQFINPIVSRMEGAKLSSKRVFQKILGLTIVVSSLGFIGLGVFGPVTVPFLMGAKTLAILPYVFSYTLVMAILTVGSAIASYHQVRKNYLFPAISLLVGFGQALGIVFYHETVGSIVSVMMVTSVAYLSSMVTLHFGYDLLLSAASNLRDFLGLAEKLPQPKFEELGKQRILIFNWRDTKHIWAGGAETYIHEISKRLVAEGHQVTLFCGNDGKCPRYETIDGISVIRRGGFYFVYIWAFLYYILKLRGKFDVIIDCENGIPFFTPLFAREKKFLLIHHIHRVVFQKSLIRPLASLASFLEEKVMPVVYRNTQVITVSESSKKEIIEMNISRFEPTVIYNGVDLSLYKPGKKADKPLILYVGRIKDHKSLPVFVRTAKRVLETHPKTEFIIAGDGPDKKPLVDLVQNLGLSDKVQLLGRVSEEEKVQLYQRAWAFMNPSLMEGWGITSIEANACGTPVIASDVPGLRDSVANPHTGFLIPYGDVNRFAERIIAICENKKFRELTGKYARDWAKNFDWDKSTSKLLDLLNK